jgi:CPA2 family monovalent cation:H+ antiporter-2
MPVTPSASPAMTMLNSPRGIIAAPARSRAVVPSPASAPAIHPVAAFVAMPATASANAMPATGSSWLGLVCSPKNTKKTAANRSRRGASRSRAVCASGPDSAIPTRNAPTAADT